MAIVITGNPGDGFVYYGPFDDAEQANAWAEDELRNAEWWVIELLNPEAT